jgi:hypothetical protein
MTSHKRAVGSIFIPSHLAIQSPPKTRAVFQRKWRTIPGGLDFLLDEAHPIGMWRRVLKELYGLHLT